MLRLKTHMVRLAPIAAVSLCGLCVIQHAVGSSATQWPLLDVVDTFVPPTGLGDMITDIVPAPGGGNKLYIVGQRGVVTASIGGVAQATPFLSLILPDHGEEGLLGMAFSPDFPASPLVYIFQAGSFGQQISRVSRFEVDLENDQVMPWTEEAILEFPRQNNAHVGGQIRFGPDGYLYIAVGDDGMAGAISGNAQDLSNFHGKILRIDPENAEPGTPYNIPAGNPLVGQVGAAPEILAWGFRNPWRFTFHPGSGALYIADVGENSREEINVLPTSGFSTGLNFGWPYKEGSLDVPGHPNPGKTLTEPLFEYPTETAVIGGEFMTMPEGSGEPVYLFGDMGGKLRALGINGDGDADVRLLASNCFLTTFGKDASGRIYAAPRFASMNAFPLKEVKSADVVLPPFFPLPAGTRIGPANISIASSQTLASIRYTVDGSDPTEASLLLPASGDFLLEEPALVKARAFYTGLPASAIASASYNLKVSHISAPSNVLNDYTRISLNCASPQATIRYTTDGSPVSPDSPVYDPSAPPDDLYVTKPTAVRARGYQNGWITGDEMFRNYTLKVSVPQVTYAAGAADLTMFSPVFLTSATSNAIIRYTTDGSIPNENSPIYSGPVYLSPGMVLTAVGFKAGMTASFNSTQSDSGRAPCRGTAYRITPSGSPISGSSGPTVSTPLKKPIHVAMAGDGTLFVAEAVYSPSLWKLANGVSTRIFQGTSIDEFTELDMDHAGNLVAVRKWNSISSLYTFTPPLYNQPVSRNLGLAASAILPEADGGFLAAVNGSITSTIYRYPPGAARTVFANVSSNVMSLARVEGSDVHMTTSSRHVLRFAGGATHVVSGSGLWGKSDGWPDNARYVTPSNLVFDRIGNMYLVDEAGLYSSRIRKIAPDGTVSTLFGPTVALDGGTVEQAPRFLNASGSLAIDDNGILYGANGDCVWKFVQDDWDNDGIPDSMETELGDPWVLGRDDRFHSTAPGGVSHVAAYVFQDNLNGMPGQGATSVGIRRMNDESLLVAARVEPGTSCLFEFSPNATDWYPMSPEKTVPAVDVVEKVHVTEGVSKRFFRFRTNPP